MLHEGKFESDKIENLSQTGIADNANRLVSARNSAKLQIGGELELGNNWTPSPQKEQKKLEKPKPFTV